jgi:hypothetical protein
MEEDTIITLPLQEINYKNKIMLTGYLPHNNSL